MTTGELPSPPRDGVAQKAPRYLGVGAIGFGIDAVVFFTLIGPFGTYFGVARLAASFIAVTVTWLLNRTLTFRSGRTGTVAGEYVRYLVASALGALANLAAFSACAPFDAGLGHVPAYGMGALAGILVNFTLYDNMVFGARPDRKA